MGFSLAITHTHPVHKIGRLVLIAMVSYTSAQAALVVNPPQPITHRVKIQPIIVSNDAGNTATFMGDSSSESYIKDQINSAWAQVGVQIVWLPTNSYTDTFTYDGSTVADYTYVNRPIGDLDLILTSAPTPPRNPSNKTINMFFVDIVPGKDSLNDLTYPREYYVTGIGNVDRDGCCVYVGSGLVSLGLSWTDGLDTAAITIAHEIGHCLGFNGHTSDINNLMYVSSSNQQKLSNTQKTIFFTDNAGIDGYDFLQPITNYDLWADSYSITGTSEEDDDFDNLSNGFEFLYGSPPNLFTQFPAPTQTPLGLTWTFTKEIDAVDDGFEYIIDTGPNLNNWYPAGSTLSGSTILSDTTSELSVRLDFGNPSGFLRADALVPPVTAASMTIPSIEEEMVAAAHTACVCINHAYPPSKKNKRNAKPTAD